MAYIIIRGGKGFVSCVEKQRVTRSDGTSGIKDVKLICGLGVMSQEEFKSYQKWAHSFKNQEERKAMVLSSGKAIITKETAKEAVANHEQIKTTVKRPPKKIKKVSETEKQKAKVLREKKWFEALTPREQKEYKATQHQRLIKTQKELQKRFKKIGKGKNANKGITTYEIDDLTQAQKYEAEIKTLKGSGVSRAQIRLQIIEREKKIRNILGDKYKSGAAVMEGYKKGTINIVDNGEPIKGV